MTTETIKKTSYTNSTLLRVKRINLADEARTIRKEEHKALKWARVNAGRGGQTSAHIDPGYNPAYNKLHLHRTGILRHAARNNHLAHAFLTGRPYSQVEQRCGDNALPHWNKIWAIALRFGKQAGLDSDLLAVRWAGWTAEAKAHIANPPQAIEAAA